VYLVAKTLAVCEELTHGVISSQILPEIDVLMCSSNTETIWMIVSFYRYATAGVVLAKRLLCCCFLAKRMKRETAEC
jgi:hypothetical protein